MFTQSFCTDHFQDQRLFGVRKIDILGHMSWAQILLKPPSMFSGVEFTRFYDQF